MEEYELTGIILDKLNIDWDKAIRNKAPIIIIGDLIYNILKYRNMNIISIKMEVGKGILERVTAKELSILVNIKGVPWYTRLSNIAEYKYCNSCKLYKCFINFNKDNSLSNKLHSICRKCDNTKSIKYKIKNKEAVTKYSREHYKNNKSDYLARNVKRRSDLLNATPIWADLEKIKLIYKLKPDGYHVDHVIPLSNINICGLHVENNLQYLLAKDNLKKSNNFLVI